MLKHKTIIVTGASRGIGRGIAERFLELGANVVLTARSSQALDGVAQELDGSRSLGVEADVGCYEDMQRVMDQARERFGGIDVLCHNAGIYPQAMIESMTEEQWSEVIHTNLTGTFLTVKACIPHLKERGAGRIVLISSITGSRVGYPGLAHYSATKAGMSGFMRTAALELAPYKITVNAIEPGSIRTESLDALGADAIETMKGYIPLGSLGEPEDIAAPAAFLASDEARFITGQTLVVDGGQTLPEIPL